MTRVEQKPPKGSFLIDQKDLLTTPEVISIRNKVFFEARQRAKANLDALLGKCHCKNHDTEDRRILEILAESTFL
jgi:hypothetical protein